MLRKEARPQRPHSLYCHLHENFKYKKMHILKRQFDDCQGLWGGTHKEMTAKLCKSLLVMIIIASSDSYIFCIIGGLVGSSKIAGKIVLRKYY